MLSTTVPRSSKISTPRFVGSPTCTSYSSMKPMQCPLVRTSASSVSGWPSMRKTDAEHPDIDPVNESEKLLQQFEVMAKLECDTCRPDDYKGWMKASLVEAPGLATALEAYKAGDKSAASLASKKLVALKGLCSDCHKPYRNK